MLTSVETSDRVKRDLGVHSERVRVRESCKRSVRGPVSALLYSSREYPDCTHLHLRPFPCCSVRCPCPTAGERLQTCLLPHLQSSGQTCWAPEQPFAACYRRGHRLTAVRNREGSDFSARVRPSGPEGNVGRGTDRVVPSWLGHAQMSAELLAVAVPRDVIEPSSGRSALSAASSFAASRVSWLAARREEHVVGP